MRQHFGLGRLRFLLDQSGQTLPWMALLMVPLIGMAGLTTDLGRGYMCRRQLQTSTDAAALAGAYALALPTATSTSVTTAVSNMSSATGGANANTILPNVTLTTTPKCLTSIANMGVLCTASPTGNNAVQVKQSVTIPTYFLRVLSVFGVKAAQSLTIETTSTAAMRGATNAQYNLAIVIDTTASMGSSDTDPNCNSTRIKCALLGLQTLLQGLSPCTPSSTSSSCTPFDQVSLFTYPNIKANTASKDTTCPTSNPTTAAYSVPTAGGTWVATDFSSTNPTYQVTTYLSNYSSTNKPGGTLNLSSGLSVASGAKSGCQGLQTPGGQGTYFAGAVYAAQSSLIAAQNANKGSRNAMIVLSDGDASSSNISGASHNPTGNKNVIYGSLDNQCQQAITAANAATTAGTAVYTIAYGAASSGCSTDTSGLLKGISPCTTMQKMASNTASFYSDSTASQNKGQCPSANGGATSLVTIFKQIVNNLTVARLIPNNAT